MKQHKLHIFILALPRFDAEVESTSYTIARYLAKDHFVYYIDNPFTIKDYLRNRHSAQMVRRQPHFFSAANCIIDTDLPDLKIIVPPLVGSLNFLAEGTLYRSLLKINERLVRKRVAYVLKERGITDFIFINSFNFHYPGLMDGLHPRLQVYHCIDPMIMPFDRKHGVVSEALLVKKSDCVICTARQLYEEKKKENPSTFFVPNAADITHSSKANDPALLIAAVLENIPGPRIGYLGNIERRMNYELLGEVIRNNTGKNFVFAGPNDPEYVPDWFYKLPNVFFTGSIPYAQMPALMKGFDVAIIPFKKDAVSKTIFPLKLFEYLGAGRPVVATDFNPDLAEFTGDTVAYCADAASFSQAINDALQNDTPEKRAARLQVAQQNTWDDRVKSFYAILDRFL